MGCVSKILTLQQRREAAGGALNQLQRTQRGAAADASQLQVMACPRRLSALLTLNNGKEPADLLHSDFKDSSVSVGTWYPLFQWTINAS